MPNMTVQAAVAAARDAADRPVGEQQWTFNPRVVGSSPTGPTPVKVALTCVTCRWRPGQQLSRGSHAGSVT